MKSVSRGVLWTVGYVVALVALVALLWVVIQIGGFLRQTQVDVNREVTQHSQEYIETKRSLLLSLMADAEASSGGQRVAIVSRFCEEYSFVDFDVPDVADSYATRNC